jgi:hypothetical protein
VGVIAWLTIPYADGYWLTEDNVGEYDHAVRDFAKWTHRVAFRPKEVLLDLESPLQDAAISSNLSRDPLPVVAMLDRNVGPAHQCVAMRGLERLAVWLDHHGYPTVAAAYPFLFDDISDGNVALSDGLDLPLPLPGEFGEVAFMVMRSVYASLIGTDSGSSILSSYIDAMKRWYGDTATFSLGVAGEGPYTSLAALVTDTRLAAALTTGSVGIYSLEHALDAYGRAGVSELFDAVLGAENDLVTAGLPLAMTGRGAPALPNAWPPRC